MEDTKKAVKHHQKAARLYSLFLVLFVLLVAIGSAGCKESNESIMMAHLQEKYPGQEFVKLRVGKAGYFGTGVPYMTCYPKGGDPVNDQVTVEMNKTEEGEIYFLEDYYGIFIREDIEADVLDILSDMNLPMKVYLDGTGFFGDTCDSTTTYADFKKALIAGEEHWRASISVFMLCEDIDNREVYAKQAFEMLSEDGIERIIDICVIADKNIYREVTRKNRTEVFCVNDESMFMFSEYIIIKKTHGILRIAYKRG